MSVAGDIVNNVSSKIGDLLGSTFTEMPDLFNLENLSTRNLSNGYGVTMLNGGEGEVKIIGDVVIHRTLQIRISYRTFSAIDGAKSKTVLQTLYDNEELILNLILKFPQRPTGLLNILDGTTVAVEPFGDGDDNFLINTITFNCVYHNQIT